MKEKKNLIKEEQRFFILSEKSFAAYLASLCIRLNPTLRADWFSKWMHIHLGRQKKWAKCCLLPKEKGLMKSGKRVSNDRRDRNTNRGCFITGPSKQWFSNSWRKMRYILLIASPFTSPLLTRTITPLFLGRHDLGRSKAKAQEVSDA